MSVARRPSCTQRSAAGCMGVPGHGYASRPRCALLRPSPLVSASRLHHKKSQDRVDATKQLEFALDIIDHLFLELKAANIREDTGGCMVQRNES